MKRAILALCLLPGLAFAQALSTPTLTLPNTPKVAAAGKYCTVSTSSLCATELNTRDAALVSHQAAIYTDQQTVAATSSTVSALQTTVASLQAQLAALSASAGAVPTITSISPTSGPPGTSISIVGTNMQSATEVLIGTVATPFAPASDTLIVAIVPAQAVTGAVKVLNPKGPSTTTNPTFTLTSQTGSVTSVTVSPASVAVSGSVQMQATVVVSGTISNAVTWSLGSGALGSIDSVTGVYTAPSVAGTYTVGATSVADPTKYGSATVTVGSSIATITFLPGPTTSVAALDYSSPAMPAYLAPVCDTNYHTQMTRITGTYSASVPTTWATNSSLNSSTWRVVDDLHGPSSTYDGVWNMDGTRLVLKNAASGGWVVMDGANYHPLYLIPNNALGDCRWDPTNADRMICVSAAGVVNYLVPSTLTVTAKWNPSSDATVVSCTGATMGRSEGGISLDGKRVQIMGTCNSVKGFFVVDLVAGTRLSPVIPESTLIARGDWPAGLTQVDNVKVAPVSTNRLIATADYRRSYAIQWTSSSPGAWSVIATGASDHEQFVRDFAGNEQILWGGGATMWDFTTGTVTSIATVGATGSAGGHSIQSPLLAPGWAGGVVNNGTGSYPGEIVLFPLKSGATVKRLGRHRSNSTSTVYYNSPMPVPSPDGLRIAFNSPWSSSGTSTYGFVLDARASCP